MYRFDLFWGLKLDMVAQLKLNLESAVEQNGEFCSRYAFQATCDESRSGAVKKKKRIRFKVPTYKKFYSIWQYDRLKFRELLNIHLKSPATSPFKNQWEILDECFVRDNKGLKLRDCDEAHIFRAGVLQRVYEKIFDYTGVMFIENPEYYESMKVIKENGLNIYPAEGQAEIDGTWQESIENRLRIHIKLLRLLREGFSIGEAVCKMKL